MRLTRPKLDCQGRGPTGTGRDYQVPAVSNETLEQVVTDESTPFLKEVVAEVCDRYDRRAHAAYEERYDHEARRKSEWSHLNEAIEIEHGRAKRSWSRLPALVAPSDAQGSRGERYREAPVGCPGGLRSRLRRGGRPRRARGAAAEAP